MTPYNRKFGLAQMKAQAANDRKNAGLQMLGGALSNAASIGMSSAMGGTQSVPEVNMQRKPEEFIQAVPARNLKTLVPPTKFKGKSALSIPGYGVMQKYKKQPFVMPDLTGI
ncbi:MAG: hypothetical protein ACOVOQ_08300 [Flavobacterium sp.]